MKRTPYLVLALFIVLSFLFTRLYAIQDGLFFFNDYGRDMFVLHQWKESLKPPILGPQNSALPFNQPAVYFYWLMPLYVLSGFSAFANVYTLVATMLGGFILGLWWMRSKIVWWPVILAFAWLVTIHPQHILQNRFVWNPSFIPAFLGLALVTLAYLRAHWSRKTAAILALSMALAVSFSYSVAPVLIVVGGLSLWWWRSAWKQLVELWVLLIGAIVFFQIPTMLFELKYHFQLTKAVLFGDRPAQMGVEVASKLNNLGEHVLGGDATFQLLLVAVVVLAAAANYLLLRKNKELFVEDQVFRTVVPIFLGTLLLTLLLPIAVHSHYIFGLSTAAFLGIASLRKEIRLPVFAALTLFWLQPAFTQDLFSPARRTVSQLESCARHVCSQEHEPLFVATESRHHVFHNGPEFRYALAHADCSVQVLEQNPGTASHLAVVEDDGQYVHGETDFYELSLFGPSTVARIYQCEGKMRVFILEKSE